MFKKFSILIFIFFVSSMNISAAEEIKPAETEAAVESSDAAATQDPADSAAQKKAAGSGSTDEAASNNNPNGGNGGNGGGQGGPDTTTGLPAINAMSIEVEPRSGSANLGIAIEVPPGRAGIQPGVSLMYSSSARSGLLGYGWIMELGSIQRSTKKGIPKYTGADSFVFGQGGSNEELVWDQTAGFYRTRTEGGFAKIEWLGSGTNSYWRVTDKKGTKYFFGNSADSIQFDPHPQRLDHIFKWNLNRVEDVHGNFMTISYSRDQNQLYPLRIDYTGNASLPPFAHVDFIYETRPAPYGYSYWTGFTVLTASRMSEVRVYVGNDLQRKYKLDYQLSSSTHQSLLTRITQYGSDGTTALPAMNFAYSQGGVRLDTPYTTVNQPNYNVGDGELHWVDMNGDGLLDIVKGTANNYQIHFAQMNNGIVNYGAPVAAVNPPPFDAFNTNIRFVDIDGNGLVDVLYGSGCPWRLWLNNGVNGYLPERQFSRCPGVTVASGNILLVDFNGDGKLDVVDGRGGNYQIFLGIPGGNIDNPFQAVNSPIYSMAPPTNIRMVDLNGDSLPDLILGDASSYQVWINNGTNGFLPPRNLAQHPPVDLILSAQVDFMDINGDGLVDMVRTRPGEYQPYDIYFNDGNGDFTPAQLAVNPPRYGFDNLSMKLVDLNDDGLMDILYGNPNQTGWMVYLNNGLNGFQPGVALSVAPPASVDHWSLIVSDLNGDNLPDMIYGFSGSPYQMWINKSDALNPRPDVLVRADNSLGAETLIEYLGVPVIGVLGAQYKGALGTYAFQSVKSVIKRIVGGDSYRTTYEYQNGLWNHPNREFRGFRKVKAFDPEGNYSETEFLQDDIYKGRALRQAVYDAAGHLFKKSETDWMNEIITPGVHFVYARRSDNFSYEWTGAQQSTGKRSAQTFEYLETPQYGNLTKAVNLGEVDMATGADIGTDSRTVETQYVSNTSSGNWLIGLPRQTVAKDHGGNEMRKSWFWYDNNPGLTDPPSRGSLTQKEDWDNNPQGHALNPTGRYAYDVYGNLRSMTDARNKTTTVSYDAAQQMFPLSTTNALNQIVTSEYYGVNGVALNDGNGYRGLWGQAKSKTDPNNQIVKTTYDVFGRPVASVLPLDTIALPTSQSQYQFFSNYVKVTQQQRIESGQPATIDGVEFYDGLGRLLQKKTKAEAPGQYVVSGQSEYNSRGLPRKQYLAFFTNSDFNVIDPITPTNPAATVDYDALGRAVRTTRADATYATVEYGDLKTTTIDENGHQQKSYADSYGRLIKKEEYLGADGRDTRYPTAPFTLYAVTEYTYDSEGNLKQTKDAHNNITTIDYDKLGRKTSMVDLDMGTWTYRYDLNGNLSSQTDAKNQTLDFIYDDLNRLTNKTDHAALNVNYTYDDVNVLYSKGRLTQAAYQISATQTNNTRFFYDRMGREEQSTKIIDTTSYDVRRSYDALNRLKDVTYPDAKKAFYTYNAAGQIETVSADSPTSGSATIARDNVSSTQADNVSTMTLPHTVGTNGTNRMLVVGISFKEARNATSTRPQANQVSFGGQNMTLIRREQFTDTSFYVVTELWYLVNPPTGTSNVSAQFNTAVDGVTMGVTSLTGVRQQAPETTNTNRSITSSASVAITTLSAGAWVVDQLVTSNSNLTVTANSNQTLLYREINLGNLVGAGSSRSVPTAGAVTMNWNFSGGETWAQVAAAFAPAVGQPQQIPIISNVDYNVHGQIIRIDYANGNVTTYVYDPQNQRLLNLLTQNAASQALQNFTYTYDSVGNILRILDQAHTATQNFQYDELNRLLAAQGQVYGTKTFQYNEIGNITLKDGLTYRYGENGAGPHAVTSLLSGTYVTETFRYDFNGNMMQRNQGAMVTDYLYDVENRLKQVKKRGVVIGEYEYDGDGGRVKRTDFRSVNTGWYSCFLAGTKVLTIEYANPNDANVESDAEGAQALRSSTRKHLSEEGLPETFNNDSNQPSAGTLSNSRRELAALGARPHSVASSDNPARLSSQRPASGGLESLGLLPYKLVPKNIEDIKIGDAVLSYDETKMQNVVSKVTEAMEEEASEYLVINDFLKVTAEHPFYVARAEVSHAATSRGMSSNDEGLPLQYVPAGELKVGDKLLTSEQQEVAVQKIEKVSLEKPIQVYNLSVAPRENNFPGAASRTSPEIAGGALTDLSHNYYVMSQSHNVTKSQDVTCDPVTLCPGDFVLVHNKLSFYAAYPGGRALVTKYVGSLYEEDNNTGRRSNFIFLGGTRVAAVTTVGTVSKILWYHDDHLGGTNVITDSLGAKKEVIEYSPFGEFSRRDRYGSSEETAWYYFTGKPYDDETGLIYFGARYYDPSLARFITPDMVVQDPTDPQTLNRYSYVSNNPINRVDPDGRSWKKFFKAIFDTFKFIHNPVQSNPFVNGIVTGNWSYARDMAIAGATGFVFGGPIGAATAMATTAVMRTPIAQWTTENLAHYYYDNVLGMSPRTAYITSYLVVSTGVSLGAEKMFASFSGAKPAQLRKEPLTNEELKNLQINGQYAGDENVFGPSLKTKGAFEKSDVKGLVQDGKLVGSFQKRTLDVPGLKQLGAQHSSVNALNASGVSVNPFSYATWGVCNQAANATLLNAGISSTVLNLGPSWDMFVTTAVYGNYGGQLGNRVLSGVNANQNYEE